MPGALPVDRQAIHDEMERARADFRRLLDGARPQELRMPTRGTRWTNEQLLFHMLFGFLLVPPLLFVMRLFGRLPRGVGRSFAGLLNAGTRPFDVINLLVAVAGARVWNHRRMVLRFDRVIADLHRRLDAEPETALARDMRYPSRWDPFFRETMTVADLYRYPAQHYAFHRHQLTLPDDAAAADQLY
ncbi:DinB family protein [Streptomyces sp. NPDC004111]|uniref:DinB family protein n=1 Tax=Streptomyces sp. NPDC004111 TaxID=3364690 RepID=UPI003675740C